MIVSLGNKTTNSHHVVPFEEDVHGRWRADEEDVYGWTERVAGGSDS